MNGEKEDDEMITLYRVDKRGHKSLELFKQKQIGHDIS